MTQTRETLTWLPIFVAFAISLVALAAWQLIQWNLNERRRAADRAAAAEYVAALRRKVESDAESPTPRAGVPPVGQTVQNLFDALGKQGLIPVRLSWDSGIPATLVDPKTLDPAAAVFVLDALEQVLRAARPVWTRQRCSAT
jgi:hypothetical protein